jgi:mRNA-degrading endonuclease toxin of MazEF toxin-antitoxin module
MFTINDQTLARFLDKEPSVSGKFFFQSADLPLIRTAMHVVDQTTAADSYVIDVSQPGRSLPFWVFVTIASALAPKPVSLLVPNFSDPVLIPNDNAPQATGSGPINFSSAESDNFTLIQFSCPRYLQVDQLGTLIPPSTNLGKGVVIASNAPPWVISTVALAYGKTARWVALTQKKGSPVIVISRDRNLPVGSELDQSEVDIAIQRSAEEAVPKRGEIWLFDDGYGDHPGIIMSSEERNRKSLDLLIIPTTTRTAHSHRHLAVTRAETGLDEDCFACYSNISRIGKDQIVRRAPIGFARPPLMEKLVQLVNESISSGN